VCCAAAEGEAAPASELKDTLYLGVLFGLWYAANIAFNIWNKQARGVAESGVG